MARKQTKRTALKSDSRSLAKFASHLAFDKKAENVVILDMRKITNYCDYFVICNGASSRQVQAIADGIEDGLREVKVKAFSNGRKNELWNLLDFGGVVVHIFNEETRQYYDLERLWIDAPRVHIPKH